MFPAVHARRLKNGKFCFLLAACSLSVGLSACVPVPSVVGRPAAVLSEGSSSARHGGGGFHELLEAEVDGTSEYVLGYYHFSRTWGLKHTWDFTLGANNFVQGWLHSEDKFGAPPLVGNRILQFGPGQWM